METTDKKVKITLDGKELLVDEGISILEAAEQNSIHIPTLCHHPALSNWGGCRICVVEVDGAPRLAASCVMPVREGMEVVTSNDRIIESRRTILEFLFAERNHNCMFCPQSGDCELQDLAYELQMDHLTVSHSFKEFPTDVTSEYMAIDHNRCILCGRCVRACQEIAGNYVLNFQNRGPQSLIGLDLNETREESTCYSCGVCMQVCPTGAIYNRYRTHYAVKGHGKDWQTIESFCPQCGLLCPTVCFVRDNNLLKVDGKIPGDNNRPDKGQLCYKGRFETLKSVERRLLNPMVRREDGSWTEETWEGVFDLVRERLNGLKDKEGGDGLFGIVSSQCSNEELMFFKDLMSQGWDAGYINTLDESGFWTISKVWKGIKKAYREASWKLIPGSDFILLLGANPYQSQPVISSLIRRNVMEKVSELGVIGSIDSMYPLTSYYVPVKPEDESLLIKAILSEVTNSAKEPSSSVILPIPQVSNWKRISDEVEKMHVPDILKKLGLDEDAKNAFYEIVKAFINSKNPMLIAGQELTTLKSFGGLSGAVYLALLKNLLPDNSLRLIILKPQGNSAGALKLGISSNEEITSKDKWKGGLVLLAGEEILDPGMLDSLNGLDFLGVITPNFQKGLADKAHVFIPKPLWMEEDGTYTSLDGFETAYKKKVINAPKGIQDTWQTLFSLAEKTGLHPDFKTWNDLCKKAEEAISSNGGIKKTV